MNLDEASYMGGGKHHQVNNKKLKPENSPKENFSKRIIITKVIEVVFASVAEPNLGV